MKGGDKKLNHPSLPCFDLCRHSHPGRERNVLIFNPDGKPFGSQLHLVNQIACSTYKSLKLIPKKLIDLRLKERTGSARELLIFIWNFRIPDSFDVSQQISLPIHFLISSTIHLYNDLISSIEQHVNPLLFLKMTLFLGFSATNQ